MASHVVVIDSTARRTVIKVTPTKPLSDVLEEACKKLGLNPSQYGLKNNNKPVDLSRSFRLSGLSSGAKLELVQASRSPAVVSVALQLPESEAQGIPNGRLTDKFPSTTTLWLVLRKFEAGAAGAGAGGAGKNLTGRSVPVTASGSSGSGVLYYEQPVINIMGRELSTFTDLQKTLGQLGFNSGSTLLRLSFKTSETPLHEAMAQIEDYFKSTGEDVPATSNQKAQESTSAPPTEPTASEPAAPATTEPSKTPEGDQDTPMSGTTSDEPPQEAAEPSGDTVGSRPVQIFSPPTQMTPLSAANISSYNAEDYVPTVEHAQAHQRLLQQASRNTRLPTDAEIQAQAQAAKDKLASITSVEIKVRFPDQSSVVSTFSQDDTGASLYSFVRDCLDPTINTEPFLLKYPSGRGQSTVPDSSIPSSKLIQGLELKGRVMVTFSWHPEQTSAPARMRKEVLKQELRSKAREIEVVDVSKTFVPEKDEGVKVNLGNSKEDSEKKGDGQGKKIPKWLKLPGKK